MPRHRRWIGRQPLCECASINPCLCEYGCGINPWVVSYAYRKTLSLDLSAQKSPQLSCRRTGKEGRTSLDPCFEQIYARRRILLGVVPARLPILFNVAQPLALKPCQSRPVNAAAWGYTDSIRINDPAGSLKALSMREDASAHERVKE